MNRVLVIIFLFSCISCSNESRTVHYQFNNVKINRLDKGDEVFFSYGYTNDVNEIIKDASVAVDCSFDHFLFGFLLFHEDGTVEVINGGGGNFKILNKDQKIFHKNYSNSELTSKLDSFKNAEYNNLYQISDDLESEKSRNKSFGSKVVIIP